MSIEQLIFTSCKTGIENRGSGFQVYSHSKGLDQLQTREILARFCLYQTPHHLPGMPTQQEIEQLFPISFSYKRYDHSRMCLTQTVYLGHDYIGESGRFGNYISHVLVIPDDVLKIYPIELYKSPILRRNLTPEESNSTEVPAALDTLVPDMLSSQIGTIDFEGVAHFINQEDRIHYLKQMIGATFESKNSNKQIIICDSNINIIYWIAAVLFAFPPESAKDITFDSYVFDPYGSDALILGVSDKGTTYNSFQSNLTANYYVFDFINDVYHEGDYEYPLIDLIEIGYSISYDSLQVFHLFLREAGLTRVDASLNNAYRLYGIKSNSGYFLKSDIAKSLELSKTIHNNSIVSEIASSIIENKETIFLNSTLDDIILANQVILRTPEISGVKEFVWDSFVQVIRHIDQDNYIMATEFITDSLSELTEQKSEVLMFLLDKFNQDLKTNNNPFAFKLYLTRVIAFLESLNISLENYLATKDNMVDTIAKRIALKPDDNALRYFEIVLSDKQSLQDDVEILITFFRRLPGRHQIIDKVAESLFAKYSFDSDLALELNRKFFARCTDEAALAMFKQSLLHAAEPEKIFWEVHSFLAEGGKAFLCSELSIIYLTATKQRGTQYINELNEVCQNISDGSNERLLLTLIHEFNSNIRLDKRISPETLTSINMLLMLADKKGLHYNKSKINLVRFIEQIKKLAEYKQSEKMIQLCDESLDIDLSPLETNELHYFCKRNFSDIVPAMLTAKQHAKFYRVFRQEENTFFRNYISALFKYSRDQKSPYSLFSFVGFLKTIPDQPAVEEIFSTHLSKLSEEKLDDMSAEIAKNYPELKEEWGKLKRKAINIKDKSITQIIKRFLAMKDQ